MPIVSSAIVEDVRQRDGRRAIRERHVDHLGGVRDVPPYLAAADADVEATMLARVPELEAQIERELVEGEIAANVAAVIAGAREAVLSLENSTEAENIAALYRAFQTLPLGQAAFIADWLYVQSDDSISAALGLTEGQMTAIRASYLAPAPAAVATIRAAGA